MKTLIVYYSRTGVTRKLATELANLLGADLEEIKDPTSRIGVMGYLNSGKEAALKKLAPIEELVHRLKDYDLILVGTPVWAFTISSPVRSFLEKYKKDLNSWALFCTQGGEGEQKTLASAEKIVGSPAKAFLRLLTKQVLRREFLSEISAFKEKLGK
ncbi:MAG: flavodoxin family protein [Patescibacteria group bacterium]